MQSNRCAAMLTVWGQGAKWRKSNLVGRCKHPNKKLLRALPVPLRANVFTTSPAAHGNARGGDPHQATINHRAAHYIQLLHTTPTNGKEAALQSARERASDLQSLSCPGCVAGQGEAHHWVRRTGSSPAAEKGGGERCQQERRQGDRRRSGGGRCGRRVFGKGGRGGGRRRGLGPDHASSSRKRRRSGHGGTTPEGPRSLGPPVASR